MDFVATQKYLIASPRKLREVVFMIKKLSPESAVEKLPFTQKRASWELRKVILTALANAKQKGISSQDLVFKEIQIGEGPRLKRFRAGARGRAKPYKRRMSHIRIVLTTKEKEKVEASKNSIKGDNVKTAGELTTKAVSKKDK